MQDNNDIKAEEVLKDDEIDMVAGGANTEQILRILKGRVINAFNDTNTETDNKCILKEQFLQN